HDDWLTREALRWDLGIQVEGLRWFWHEMVLTPYQSPLPSLRQIFGGFSFADPAAVDRYLDVLGQVPGYVAALETRARAQLERGIVVPKQNLPAIQGLVRAALRPAADGPFAVAQGRLESLAQADRDRLAAGVATLVAERIDPALQRLAAFLEGEYAQASGDQVGAARFPDGDEYYRFAVRRSTTLEITPEEVHRIGHEMVAELDEAMATARAEVGFTGSREEFHRLLRTDPKYFPETHEEVGERLMAAADAMEAKVEGLFESRPAAPYGVERLDPALEGAQTYGYYDPPTPQEPRGIYYFNGSRLDQRSWIGLAAISLHELVPGHHFQIARQLENESLPEIRRNSMHGAYIEGWGSYASYLGEEAGIYEDAYSRYGMYVLEIFLASRLVVDTGMNALGWSLEQGRAYQLEHTLESETQIASESLRYSTDMPAQALAYQMGKRKLLELRRRAEEALGERFDVRAFHEAILAPGSLPLAVLERHVERFVQQERGE
ncbi:MAG TPA: DUF885 domain-containing protein, partial [Thermoanaerobaculia bacterium]|nr:DUF885 domain-containing protein [Thermoanaerobaculia bacterium]